MSAVYMWCHNNSSLTLCWRVQEHLIHSPICTIHQHLLIYCENFPLSRSIWMPFQSYFLLGRGFLQMLWGSSYSFHFFKFLVYQTSQKIFTRHEMKPKEEKKRVKKRRKKTTKKLVSNVTHRSNSGAKQNVNIDTSACVLFQPLTGVRLLLVFWYSLQNLDVESALLSLCQTFSQWDQSGWLQIL